MQGRPTRKTATGESESKERNQPATGENENEEAKPSKGARTSAERKTVLGKELRKFPDRARRERLNTRLAGEHTNGYRSQLPQTLNNPGSCDN